ncbi:MAG TPA: stalk domain-containing protein [Syntrophomonadaceae bacterium]|nr:stalk domain-containing protein [Syntrophomonadaceae bacterium]
MYAGDVIRIKNQLNMGISIGRVFCLRRICSIVLIVLIVGICPGLPVYAEDSIDTQIMNNNIDGIKAQKDQKYEDAIRYYTKSIELDPNNAETLIWRGSCYYYLKNYNASLKDLDMALILNPKNYEAIYDKACIYSLTNDQTSSLKLLQQVLVMDSRWKERAIKDTDLDKIRDSDLFQSLTGITILIDGKALESDTAPMVVGGRTLVPLRAIFEALGANVEWDGESQTIHCIKDQTSITLQIDNNEAKINDKPTTLDTPATISNDRTYVPLRFVAESLGAAVTWVADTEEIYITSPDDNTSTIAVDEKKIMESLKKNLDYCPIDGASTDPFGIDNTEGLAILVAKSQEDLQAFQSLSDENRKALLNDYVQAKWGDFIGCKSVCIYFVFDGKRYAETVTGYQSPTTNLNLYKYKQGIDTNVVIQDKKNSFYYDYYVNKKPIFNLANTKKDAVSEELIPHKINFNNNYFGSISYPKTWKVVAKDQIVYFLSPSEDNDLFTENVCIHVAKLSTDMMKKLSDPDAYIEFAKHQSEKVLTDLNMETAKLDVKKDWGNGYEFVYTCRQGLATLKGRSMVFVYNNGFTVYYEVIAEQKNYDKYNRVFDAMMNTLDLKNSSSEAI